MSLAKHDRRKEMIAEILSTGDEVCSGAVVDSNAAHIAQKLEEVGIVVARHQCVGDDMNILVETLKEIGQRADVAVVSGGLGPTEDDLTAAAAAAACGVELVFDQIAFDSIVAYFQTRERVMNPSNRKQALIPKGAQRVLNPVGTAPGFILKIQRCLFFFVPGVPREMKHMLIETVLPRLAALHTHKQTQFRTQTIATFGLPESAVGERLTEFKTDFAEIKLGLRVKFPEIHIKLYGHGKDPQFLDVRMQQATAWVMQRLGSRAFAADGRSMQAVVGGLLQEQSATLAVAESCTGGLISHWLTNVAGSSKYFLFAGITYANDAKTDILGVSPETIAEFGAVHETTAKAMAEGAKRIAAADYGIATSGIAGPDGGTTDKPVGTICIGMVTPKESIGKRYYLQFGERELNKKVFAMAALDLLRRELMARGGGK